MAIYENCIVNDWDYPVISLMADPETVIRNKHKQALKISQSQKIDMKSITSQRQEVMTQNDFLYKIRLPENISNRLSKNVTFYELLTKTDFLIIFI